MFEWKKNKILILILFIGIFLRLFHLGVPVLNFDEAEMYLASQNIFRDGYPKGFYKVPFYENAHLYFSESKMYEFESTNFYKTDMVLEKGWLPYYLIAGTSLFGTSEAILRFPFALIGIISLFFFYKLSKELFNKRTALIASFFYATSPSILFYERMIRYYAPMMLFIILSSYFLLRAIKTKDKKYFFGTGITLGLLFHTNILICTSLITFLVVYALLMKTKIDKNIWKLAGIFALMTLPWIILTGFIKNLTGEPRNKILFTDFGFTTITAGINNQGSLYILLYIGLIFLIISLLKKNSKANKNGKKDDLPTYFWSKKTSIFIALYILLMILIPSFLVPETSFEEKLFFSIIPIFLLIIARVFETTFLILEKKGLKKLTILIILFIIILSIVHINLGFAKKGHNIKTIEDIITKEYHNPYIEINKIIEERTTDPLILTTFDQFPLMFYTNYSVQLIWPIRKEFIDNYQDELVIIEMKNLEGNCNYFYTYAKDKERCDRKYNYIEKIKNCDIFPLSQEENIYFCNINNEELRNLPTNLGLFFSDFPEGSPPDFIWDLVPFNLSLNISNMGDSEVKELKIILEGDIGGKEFDTDKKQYYFKREIEKIDRLTGDVDFEYFSLGEAMLNHKSLQKERVIDMNVSICYPYSNKISARVCNDNASLCDIKTSAGPINTINISTNETKIIFELENQASGDITDFRTCKKDDEKIETSSKDFDCEIDNKEIICKLKNNSTGIVSLEVQYDYIENFNKFILLRSRERNEYDFENYKK